jgi:hypothetical protein
MDMRLKVIITVFAIVGVFYFFQFIFQYMNKKKEHFTSSYYDDVERYEDAPVKNNFALPSLPSPSATSSLSKPPASDTSSAENTSHVPVITQTSPLSVAPAVNGEMSTEKEKEAKSYELRILLLEEIDKLQITDKTIKGNVMESLFSEISMKELQTMSKEQRVQKVKDIYAGASSRTAAPTVEVKPSIHDNIKSYFTVDNLTMPKSPESAKTNDVIIKKASEKIDLVIDNLKDMKNILNGKEEYSESYPDKPKQAESSSMIEGFENSRSFAYV